MISISNTESPTPGQKTNPTPSEYSEYTVPEYPTSEYSTAYYPGYATTPSADAPFYPGYYPHHYGSGCNCSSCYYSTYGYQYGAGYDQYSYETTEPKKATKKKSKGSSSTEKVPLPQSNVRSGEKVWEEWKYTCLCEINGGRQISYGSTLHPKVGDYLIVEGDMGEDMGEVKAVNSQDNITYPEEDIEREVKRRASEEDITRFQVELPQKEQEMVESAQIKVNKLKLQMRMVRAVYQFDEKKITFYYQSRARIDFKHLLGMMYKTIKCRIWLERLDTLSKDYELPEHTEKPTRSQTPTGASSGQMPFAPIHERGHTAPDAFFENDFE